MAGKTISLVLGKGSMAHNNRDFFAENVDPERTYMNRTYAKQPLAEAYRECFGKALEEYNAKQKRKDRMKDDYISEIKHSGNGEKVFYENVIQFGDMYDTGIAGPDGKVTEDARVAMELLDEYARTFQERNPNLYVFNSVLHMDEATPHLHIDYIPVAHGYKTGLATRNSLSKAYQQMGIPKARNKLENETTMWHQREREYLAGLARERGLEIYVKGVDRPGLSLPEYKETMAEVEDLKSKALKLQMDNGSLISEKMKLQKENGRLMCENQMLEKKKDRLQGESEHLESENNELRAEIEAAKQVREEIIKEAEEAEERANKALDSYDEDFIKKNTIREEYLKLAADAIANDPDKPVAQRIKTRMGKDTDYVKVSVSDWKKMTKVFRITKTNAKAVELMAEEITKLKNKYDKLVDKYEKCKVYLQDHKLYDAFMQFISPKAKEKKPETVEERISVKKLLEKNKVISAEQNASRVEQIPRRRQDIAI